MEEKINDYLKLFFLSGIDIYGWKLIHNIDFSKLIRHSKMTEELLADYKKYPQIFIYRSEYGEVELVKNKALPEDTFFVIPRTVEIQQHKRFCKCCGQVIK